jgi:tetratricopeptide (TPR) repeat protein
MAEQSNVLRVLEGILSSQSFELLKSFSSDESWTVLAPDEKDLLAQLFLLSAEANAQSGDSEEVRKRSIDAYRAACRLCPGSARSWYRLGAYLGLGEQEADLYAAIEALSKAIELDGRFFDAHYALGSAYLRLGAVKGDEEKLLQAAGSFSDAHALVVQSDGESQAPAEFFWHWGIVWFLLSKESGEPVDLKKAVDHYEQARQKGLSRSDFLNDYANAIVELALLTSNDALIPDAVGLYSASIAASEASGGSDHDRAIRFFNIGCCFQHLYDLSHDSHHFDQAEQAFSRAASLGPDLAVIWQRWGYLLFYAARFLSDITLVQEALRKFQTAEKKGSTHPLTLALCAQALLWVGREEDRLDLFNTALSYAQRAYEAVSSQGGCHPEIWAALALCQFEYGYYFHDHSFFTKGLDILQKALAEHPKSALLWHTLALVKLGESEGSDSEKTLKESLVCFLFASQSPYACFPYFWNDWGMALLTLADWMADPALAREALERFETAIRLAPDPASPWSYNMAKTLDLIGDFCDDEGCYEQAIHMLTELLSRDPTCQPAMYQLASTYFHLGELSDDHEAFMCAITLFEQYLDTDPEDECGWVDYALALIHKGVQEKTVEGIPQAWFRAEEALMQAIALGSDQAYYHAGCLYSLMGDFAQACDFLERCLARDGLPPLNDVREDPWLQPISSTAAFHAFLAKAETSQQEGEKASSQP